MAANQNVTQLTQQSGTAAPTSLFYAVTNGTTDTGLPLSVLVNSLGLTGTPTTPTATTGTNTTQIASCAFVQNQLTSTLASYAQLASPTFTGTVVIPTVTISAGTINNTSVGATTPSTGSFTTLASSGLATLSSMSTSSATITGGSINSTPVGATTPNTGKFTTLTATGIITPATVAGIAGTATNDSAQAGSWGEYQTLTGGSGAITSGSNTNITSFSLTAGDWDVSGVVGYSPQAGCTVTTSVSGISTVSSTAPSLGGANAMVGSYTSTLGTISIASPVVRVSLSTTTTVYLIGLAIFSGGTCNAQGFLRARRVR